MVQLSGDEIVDYRGSAEVTIVQQPNEEIERERAAAILKNEGNGAKSITLPHPR